MTISNGSGYWILHSCRDRHGINCAINCTITSMIQAKHPDSLVDGRECQQLQRRNAPDLLICNLQLETRLIELLRLSVFRIRGNNLGKPSHGDIVSPRLNHDPIHACCGHAEGSSYQDAPMPVTVVMAREFCGLSCMRFCKVGQPWELTGFRSLDEKRGNEAKCQWQHLWQVSRGAIDASQQQRTRRVAANACSSASLSARLCQAG